jgi:multidrug efflux system membrane fusion protein
MSQYTTETGRPKSEGGPADAEAAARKKRRGRLFTWAVIVAVVVGLGVVAYRARMNSGTGAAQGGRRFGGAGGPPPPVMVRTARKGDINVILNGLGTVTPLATVTIRTQISGQLVQINFTEGQMVNKGDVLAVIDQRPYEAALKQAQGQLQQAEAQLQEAQSDLDRYVTLSTQDSISKQQVDAQRALVSQYEGVTKTDQGTVDNAQLNLTYCNITAPVSGRVGLRLVDQGNYVTPGDATGLVILTQVKPITVIFTLPEDNIPALQERVAAGAKLQVDAYDRTHSKKLASGSLTNVDNIVDTTTGTLKLRATFANDDGALFPNQFVNIAMLLNVDEGVTVIPTSAIERGQQGSFVYVVSEKGAAPHAAGAGGAKSWGGDGSGAKSWGGDGSGAKSWSGGAAAGSGDAAAAKPTDAPAAKPAEAAGARQWGGGSDAKPADGATAPVYVVNAVNVTLGDTEGERVAVVTGISPGDKVVVDGADRLKDGMTVIVQAPTGGGAGDHKRAKPSGGP